MSKIGREFVMKVASFLIDYMDFFLSHSFISERYSKLNFCKGK